jgi:hypothetical protein
MIEIQLTKGMVAIVDDDCPIEILEYKWQYHPKGYAKRISTLKGKKTGIFMHREIIGANKNEQVDHVNGDKLDNRKCNLRLCTNSQNQSNRKISKKNTSGFKGVQPHVRNGKMVARITVNKKNIYLGLFDSAKDAAIAYNEAAIKYHGEFANLNKID